MINLVASAMQYAILAHDGQMRKYGGEEYIRHPARVAALATLYDDITDDEVAAAWLHDVVEDCGVPIGEIQQKFGNWVAQYVWDLTEEFTKEGYPELNRKTRKYKETERITKICDNSLRLKLCDISANLAECIRLTVETPTDFKQLMFDEKKYLLEHIELRCLDNPKLEELYISVCSLHTRLGADLSIALKSQDNT